MNSNEPQTLATQDAKTVKGWLQLDSTKKQLAMALPKHCTADRFARVAMTALVQNPKLQECSMDTVILCLLKCAQYGIEPDGRRAHLIPFFNGKKQAYDCQLIFDYKGLAELVRRSGDVSYIHADVVRANDTFDYLFGTGAILKHRPALKDRGEIICAYSFVKLKDGSEDFDVMALEDVDTIRDRSQNYQNAKKKGYSNPWDSDYAEMAKKTVFRRHSKWLPLSPDVKAAIEEGDEPLTETERFEAAKPAKRAPIPQDPAKVEKSVAGTDKVLSTSGAQAENPPSDGKNEPSQVVDSHASTGSAQKPKSEHNPEPVPEQVLSRLMAESAPAITAEELGACLKSGGKAIPRGFKDISDLRDDVIAYTIENWPMIKDIILAERKERAP